MHVDMVSPLHYEHEYACAVHVFRLENGNVSVARRRQTNAKLLGLTKSGVSRQPFHRFRIGFEWV